MRHYYIFSTVSAAIALVACSEIITPPVIEEQVEISARLADNSGTKTSMGTLSDQKYPVLWSAGDKIGLLSEDGISTFTITSGAGTKNATFGGDASSIVGTYPQTTVYPAAYPAATAFIDRDGETIWVGSEVPYMQTYNAAKGFSDNAFPMAAVTTNPLDYDFYNLAGIVQLKIQYTPASEDDNLTAKIRQIILKGNNKENVAGGVAMKFDRMSGEYEESDADKDNGKTVKACGNAYKNVIIDLSGLTDGGLTLTSTGVGKASPAATVNIVVIPQEFSNGFTVQLQDGNTNGISEYVTGHMVYSSLEDEVGTLVEDAVTVGRSELIELGTIEYLKASPQEIANSYVISEPGDYVSPAYAYGNRMDIRIGEGDPNFNLDDIDADIYWTDIVDSDGNKIDAISNLNYLKFQDGTNYLMFTVNENPATPGQAYRGNVFVALYNKKNNDIYWSWHIWLSEELKEVVIDGACASGSYTGLYPDGSLLEYEADAASGKMIILDRNVGALHALPSECDPGQIWQTYGLYYQDGRKDPFIGGAQNGGWNLAADLNTSYDEKVTSLHKFENEPFTTGTHKTWTNPKFAGWSYNEGNITLTQSIRDPHKYSFDKSKTWQWTNYLDSDNMSWMDSSQYPGLGKHGPTGLTYGGHEAYWNRTKTIMDPCPTGYSVLGERGGYFFANKGTKVWHGNDADGYGLMYSIYGYDIWWPAAGVRSCEGLMAGVGKYGFYFFYDHIKADHGGHGLLFQITGNDSGAFITEPNKDAVITNHATPIRCVRDKQFVSDDGENRLEQYPIKNTIVPTF